MLSLVFCPNMWTLATGDTDTGPGHMELERELAAQWAELTRGRATPLASLVTVQGAGRGLRAEQEMQGGQVRLSVIRPEYLVFRIVAGGAGGQGAAAGAV